MAQDRWISERLSVRFMIAAWIGGILTGGIAGTLLTLGALHR